MAPFTDRLRCAVLASNYRGNGGSEGKDEFGGGDARDVAKLIEIGREQPWWDGRNIFLLGWSRGGMMVYLLLKAGIEVNAAVVGAGLADLFDSAARRDDMERVYQRYLPPGQSREEALIERSAIRWPSMLNAPLLLLHGDADDKVDVAQARALNAALEALGKEVRYVEYAEGNHALKKHWQQWVDEAARWFEAHRR